MGLPARSPMALTQPDPWVLSMGGGSAGECGDRRLPWVLLSPQTGLRLPRPRVLPGALRLCFEFAAVFITL